MQESNKEIVRKVNQGFLDANIDSILEHFADDITWNMIGHRSASGKDDIRAWLGDMKECEPPKFTEDILIAEGDTAICSGDMTMTDKEGATSEWSYCDIYRFSDGKITELRSFLTRTDQSADEKRSAGA